MNLKYKYPQDLVVNEDIYQMNERELKTIVYKLGNSKSIIYQAELLELGASLDQVEHLVATEILYPSAKGIYMPINADFEKFHSEVEAAARFPYGIMCLITALNYHELTTQMPREIWIAYPENSPEPIELKLPIRGIPMSDIDLSSGIDIHMLEGIPVKIFNVAKTIADCFLWSYLVGTDVAEEAFEEAIAYKKCTIQEVLSYFEKRNLNKYSERNLNKCIERINRIYAK